MCVCVWYTKLRNRYSRDLKNRRSDFFSNEINKHKKNSKELWKVLKSMLQPDESCVSVVKFNGVIEADDSIICNKFNSFFVNSVLDINQNIASVSEPSNYVDSATPRCHFRFQKITLEQLKTICFNLTKTAGIGNVSSTTIQDCYHVIGEDLLMVITGECNWNV